MVRGNLVEHHSKLLRRTAAGTLLNEPFEEDLSRADSGLDSAVGSLDRAGALALLGRVADNPRGDIGSATIAPPLERPGDRTLDPRKRAEVLAAAVDRIECRLRSIWDG